jgi:translation initiation factor IF-3
MPVPEAITLARESGVDVVEVAPNTDPPVCRLMDYGKFRYDQAKKEREAKKAQKSSGMREVRMRTRIGDHDMQRKTNKIREFLAEGDKVKVSVQFRGREMTHPEIGNQLLGKVARSLLESARVETPPVMERRMMSMVLVPGRKDGNQPPAPQQTDAKAENA